MVKGGVLLWPGMMLSPGVGDMVSLKAVAGFTLLPNYPQIDPEKLWITPAESER